MREGRRYITGKSVSPQIVAQQIETPTDGYLSSKEAHL